MSLANQPNGSTETVTNSWQQTEDRNIDVVNAMVGTSMTIVTFAEQLLVFFVFYSDKGLQTPNYFYIISLALADFLLSIISLPVWTIFTTIDYWPVSQLLCDIWSSADHFLTFISMHTIVFVSVERYRSVKYPLRYMVSLTSRRMKVWLIGIWICNCLFWTCYVFLTQYMFGKERDPNDCRMYYADERLFIICHGIIFFTLPVLATAIVYLLIYQKARKVVVAKLKGQKSDSRSQTFSSGQETSFTDISNATETVSSVSTISGSPQETSQKKISSNVESKKHAPRKEDNDGKALRTIALLTITFAICWLPFAVYSITIGIAPGYLDFKLLIASYWLGYANSMLNPLCYSIGIPSFRRSLRKLNWKKG